MRKLHTFRRQFSISFLQVLLLSILCTAIVWGGSIYYLIFWETFKPANHYENMIPKIQGFIDQHHKEALSPAFKDAMEEIVPTEMMKYQILDSQGKFLYGWEGIGQVEKPQDLLHRLNKTIRWDKSFIRYSPILNQEGILVGFFVLSYPLDLVSSNQESPLLAVLFLVGNMAAPFLFVILFTYLFASRIGSRLKPPIEQLIGGARKIQQQDLDFTFTELGGSKELLELTIAFEEMRNTLQKTLTSKWKMEQERREMVAALAHDLRTPLTIILGHVENLLEEKEKAIGRLESYLNTIRGNTVRAVQLLEEMRSLSEIEQPEFRISPEEVDLHQFCIQKEKEYRTLCHRKSINFHLYGNGVSENPSKGKKYYIDAYRLEQMLDNLVENSIRYTPEEGEIRLRVSTIEEKGELIFELFDTGPGFTQMDLKHLFEIFYQGDRSRSKEKGSGGLGLYIVKILAEKHGGSIIAGSRKEYSKSIFPDVAINAHGESQGEKEGAYVRLTIREAPPTPQVLSILTMESH